jgi:hypothetical protein
VNRWINFYQNTDLLDAPGIQGGGHRIWGYPIPKATFDIRFGVRDFPTRTDAAWGHVEIAAQPFIRNTWKVQLQKVVQAADAEPFVND